MTKLSRHRARELALKGLYALEIGEAGAEKIVESVIVDEDADESQLEFARSLFEIVRDERKWADETITNLATNWDIGRMAVIDLIIMRMAISQLKQMPDIPVKVVINEAIELAKEYSTAESSAFINGILDSFVKASPEICGR